MTRTTLFVIATATLCGIAQAETRSSAQQDRPFPQESDSWTVNVHGVVLPEGRQRFAKLSGVPGSPQGDWSITVACGTIDMRSGAEDITYKAKGHSTRGRMPGFGGQFQATGGPLQGFIVDQSKPGMVNLDVTFAAPGEDHVCGNGKGNITGKSVSAKPAVTSSITSQPKAGELSGRPWMHNGSEVVMDDSSDQGTLTYNVPKAAIRSAVKPGTVLFRGNLSPGKISGTAFAFKDGCPPAPYPVRGAYSNHGYTLTLRGAGPVRNGCEVISYSESSPHAKIKFTYVLND